MARIGLLSATPRYSTMRGRSVIRQTYGDPGTVAPIVPLTARGGLLRVPVGMGMTGRSLRAASEPPIRASIQRSTFTVPSSRRVRRDDDITREYASVMADVSLQRSSDAAYDADDIYHTSRARDHQLLTSASAAVANAEPKSAVSRRISSCGVATRPPVYTQAHYSTLTSDIDFYPRKTPKSQFGAKKKRELDMISRDSATAALHASVPGPAVVGAKSQPSSRRKEIRRAICRSRNDPTYFY